MSSTNASRMTRRSRLSHTNNVSPASSSRRKKSANGKGPSSPLQPVLTADTQSSLSKHLPAPRTVTPTGPTTTTKTTSSTANGSSSNNHRYISSAPSWEDYDEGVFGAVNRKAKQRQQAEQQRRALQQQRTAKPSNNEDGGDDDDMPMDEMMGSLKNSSNQNHGLAPKTTLSANHPSNNNNNNSNLSDVRLAVASNRSIEASTIQSNSRPPIVNTMMTTTVNDDVSSLGGVEDQSTGIGRILNALKHNSVSHRPNSLNAEERLLWEAIQKTIGATRQEHLAKRRALENQLNDSNAQVELFKTNEAELERQLAKTKTNFAKLQKQQQEHSDGRESGSASLKLRLSQVEQKLEQCQAELDEKDAEHEAEVRAIQRVLADVTTEREDEQEALTEKVSSLTRQIETLQSLSSSGDSSSSWLQEKEALTAKCAALQGEKDSFEAEKLTFEEERASFQALKDEKDAVEAEKENLKAENLTLQEERDALEAEKLLLQEKATQSDRALPETLSSTSSPDNASAEKIQKLEADAQELLNALKHTKAEKVAAKRETDKKQRRLINLERDLKVTKTQMKKVEGELSTATERASAATSRVEELEQQISISKKRNEELVQALDEKERQLKKSRRAPTPERSAINFPPAPPTPPRQASSFDNDSVSSEEVEVLQKSLADTVSSLENAKKIIASLENANGSLALDMRAKVKSKEEELAAVQNESAERKRRLDSLATELRDLQRKQGNVDRAERQSRAQIMRLKALTMHLQKSVSGLQSAAVVHEISTSTGQPDPANVENISEILSDTLTAIRTTLDMAEQCIDEFDDQSEVVMDGDLASEVGRTLDAIIRTDREAAAKDLKDELDQKRLAVRRLEDAMRKQSDEMKRLRSELDKRGDSGETEQLKLEIRSLRDQCATNMDVLAMKERELSVLRSSLSVDDNDAGYISDDVSEQEDEGDSVMSPNLNQYGHAEAEALATILSNGRAIDLPTRSREVQALKNDLLKASGEKEKACRDLQAERESLANAKMIISSLEKANKSMMEDLRSRLQDSNTAIQSLLDKSMEHEKNSSDLKAELEKMKQEKLDAEQKHQTQMKKLKDEAKVYSLRIASKDRELNNLRQRPGTAGSEEKKDDVEESE